MMNRVIFILYLAVLHSVFVIGDPINERPIIGILSQPSGHFNATPNESYIAASYIKYFESGGARVVPILYNSTNEELKNIFQNVNGIMFPGGSANMRDTQFGRAGRYLLNLAIQANQNGDYFPVFGHCLGFELIMVAISEDFWILDLVTVKNVSLPLHFTSLARSSRMFGSVPTRVYNYFQSEPITLNAHKYGIKRSHFNETPKLYNFFSVLSTNYDHQGTEFISSVEAKVYPIYAIQWHSEKPQFEWLLSEDINHSAHAIESMSAISQFYVSELRKSSHHFDSLEKERDSLIYNYNPIYCDDIIPDFEQCYVFQ